MNNFTCKLFLSALIIFTVPFASLASVNIGFFQSFLKSDGVVNIDWITTLEVDNDFFTLERSSNGIEYSTFAIVQGSGTTATRKQYRVEDNNPYPGKTFYRLIQTDIYGQNDTINVVKVMKAEHLDIGDIQLAPNPVVNGGSFKVNGYSRDYNNQPVKIYSLTSGQLVFETTAGEYHSDIQLPNNLSSGMYVIKMVNIANETVSQPFIVR